MKFAHEFGEVLAMPLMYEAVIRVRATRGMCLQISIDVRLIKAFLFKD